MHPKAKPNGCRMFLILETLEDLCQTLTSHEEGESPTEIGCVEPGASFATSRPEHATRATLFFRKRDRRHNCESVALGQAVG